MDNYAIIDDSGIVVNLVIWDGNIDTWAAPEGHTAVQVPGDVFVTIGAAYAGGVFTNPEPAAPAFEVPQSVSKRQAVLALYDAGKWEAFSAAINAAGPRALLEWEATATVERTNPLVAQLGPALGLDLDALFITAAGL